MRLSVLIPAFYFIFHQKFPLFLFISFNSTKAFYFHKIYDIFII